MSRKIDALVAEHVMGIEVVSDSRELDIEYIKSMQRDISDPKQTVTTEVWNTLFTETNGFNWGLKTLENYSTDIAAAWRVVEKEPHISIEKYLKEPGKWVCTVPGLRCWSDTAPMAICLAALKAKGVDIKALEERI